MTAGEVVDRIKTHIGVPWRANTYRDTFKSGGAATPVTGIATTVFATFDMIQRAVGAGLNMIIPHEVTYWNDRDDVSLVRANPLYAEKLDYLTRNNVVIFRMHDHMHDQRPDFLYLGSARELGLDPKYETPPGSHRFTVPETTLGTLAASVQKRLGARAIRVVGDPNARVRRIQLGVGYATPAVNSTDIDVVISGEQQEADGAFDSPAYALDAATLGLAKGWIMLGHAISEEAGMLEMANWIKGFVPEVPVELVKAGEPFWGPK